MRLEVNRGEGLRNDLLLTLERSEIETALLSVANRDSLMALTGMPRHRKASQEEQESNSACKIALEDHLRRLGIVNGSGKAHRRAFAISNRSLGNNHGHIAWQRSENPRLFRIKDDPCDYPTYSCLTAWRSGELTIEELRLDFDEQRAYRARDGRDVSDEIEWATFGQHVLRCGTVARIEELADQFYDVRHLLAYDHNRKEGERIRADIYRDYPLGFKESVLRAWRELGVPRARYYHNAVGLSRETLFVLQREGTIEEIALWLKQAGAEDGLILDNGGSVTLWAWWVNHYEGGMLSTTVDYRPRGTSAIAFLLRGPLRSDLPGGSVSYTVF